MDFKTASRKLSVVLLISDYVHDKTFDDVSVTEICDLAQISRSTFYRLFPDKNAVLVEASGLVFAAGVAKIGRSYTWHDGLYVSMSGIRLMWSLMRSARLGQPQQFIDRNGLNAHVETLFETLAYRNIELTERLKFQANFYTSMEMIEVDQWVCSENPMPLGTFVDLLVSCVPRDLFDALELAESSEPARPLDFSSLLRVATES